MKKIEQETMEIYNRRPIGLLLVVLFGMVAVVTAVAWGIMYLISLI